MRSLFTILLLILETGVAHSQDKTTILDSLSRYVMQHSLLLSGRIAPPTPGNNPNGTYLLTGIEKTSYSSGNNTYEAIYSGIFSHSRPQLKITFYDNKHLPLEEDISTITDTFTNADLLDRVKPQNLNSDLLRVYEGKFHGSYLENERKIKVEGNWITVRKAKGRILTASGPKYSSQYSYIPNCPALERNIFGSLHGGNWIDSVFTETIDCNTRNITGKYLDTYTFNSNGKLAERVYSNWENGNWIKAYHAFYTYNEYGAENESIIQEFSNGQLVSSAKRQLITDNNGFDLEFKYKGKGSSWELYYKTLLLSDSLLNEGKLCEYIKQENKGIWVNTYRYRVLFSNSLPLQVYVDRWDEASQKWNLYTITKRQYLTLGNENYVVKEENYSDGFGTQLKFDVDEQYVAKKSYLGTCLTLEDFENENFLIEKIVNINLNYQDTMDIWTSIIWDGSAYTKFDSIVNIYDTNGNIKLMTYAQFSTNRVSFIEKFAYLYTLQQPEDIGNILNKKQVILYPNPSKNIVYFENAAAFNALEVYDFSGKLILSRKLLSGSGKVSLQDLSLGMYVFKFLSGKRVATYKILKY